MAKRILGALASLAMATVVVAAGAPTPALACTNPEAFTQVVPNASVNGVKVQMPLNVAHTPYWPYETSTSHWLGIQNNSTGNLVQAGYDIDGLEPSKVYGFFWEFEGEAGTGTVHVTPSWYNGNPDSYAGDMILYTFWYPGSTYWGLQINDVTKGLNWGTNIHPPAGYNPADWIGPMPIVATEKDYCFNDLPLYNDGVQSFKQPQFEYQNSGWLYWDSCVLCQSGGDLHDNQTGDLLETASRAVSPAEYIYHTWQNHQ